MSNATAPSPEDQRLHLTSILISSLPPTLFTADAPDRYTVEAVFNRPVEREEVIEIESTRTRDVLTETGHSTVELKVSDRRLEIANTSLEELRDGLATVITDILDHISEESQNARDEVISRAERAASQEHDRVVAVELLAMSVDFESTDETKRRSEGLVRVWEDEGGDPGRN
ncbi:hypothetical protein [Leucobacter tardus]|uniref:Uncharacterized protein n=1 Tax=Leucobacter tardus TaxID=501483 RepID=A0A939TL66_9MICO|nr:hypothetical protein [Leucobacter tardus]MBO2991001.1 hypothetical protein [Leucobacter tardus]